MRIMVFDVPAEFGGALTILKQYYAKAVDDTENEWIFIISKPELEERDNIKVLKFPWVKKSWLHRLWFDNAMAKKLIKKYNPDKIISLQNTVINTKLCFQELYVHQALIFSEKRFTLKENPKFWVYQNIISKLIIRSVKKADKVVIQTNWMKEGIIKLANVDEKKIAIEVPKVELQKDLKFEKTDKISFFYPAGASVYKNHKVIYDAVKILRDKGYNNFKIYLTLEKNDNRFDENIEFCGYMSKEQVNENYKKSALLFPSYIESFGLPLLEARTYGCPVIASDCSFSREILNGYDRAQFFNPFSSEELADKMIEYIKAF